MFNINLLDKNNIKNKSKNESIFKELSKTKEQSSNMKNENNGSYILNIIVFSVVLFFVYTIYSSNKVKTFSDISPGNILSLIYSDTNRVINIKNDEDRFVIVKDISNCYNLNIEQSNYDSLLNTTSYISVKGDRKKIHFIFNWHTQSGDQWNVRKLYDILRKSEALTNNVELFDEKIIMVSRYDEMINLFNTLKSLNVLYMYNYNIELLETKKSNNNYYKILIF